ncbi:hypothetical protein [Cytophaga aurantiaca]|uniref:hypothetical protein n=1 Tax=Cytophaga aurantiaca TaxID=29530 RepID=UPI000376479A|nr:hypothetical protein [Cytophaga aurantiaca]
MRLLSFLKAFFKSNIQANASTPVFWEDDYCQIEIVPFENRDFILAQSTKINTVIEQSKIQFGFTEIFGRESMPANTVSKEIRIDYFENLLVESGFQKSRYIQYETSKMLDSNVSKTKAYTCSNFILFFDVEGEFINNIWLTFGLIVSVTQYNCIETLLHSLGNECDMILIDWNSTMLIDLKEKNQINEYLMRSWK